MNYTFYVEFLRNRDPLAFVAALIRFAIKRPYNHVEICAVPDNPNMPTLYFGAVAPKSRKAFLSEVRKHYKVERRYKLAKKKDVSDIAIIKYLNARTGIRYSYIQNLVLLPMACWHWLKKKLSRSWLNGEREENCVEYVCRAMIDMFGYEVRAAPDVVEFEDLVVALEDND